MSTTAANLDDLVSQTVRALCRLGHVRSLADLGTRGPLDASAGRTSAFACLFGRDSVRMALDLLDDFPAVSRGTIRRLTALQGRRMDVRSEEEPGRILHEHRRPSDPRAAPLRAVWDFPYYGAVDVTPLYVILIAAHCRRHGRGILEDRVRGRDGRAMSVREGLERAVDWIERRLVRDGYVLIARAQPNGIQHQFWEDSYDSQFMEDGQLLADHVPYASIAVQGYAYDALLAAARLSDDAPGVRRRRLAARLRETVLTDFWLPDLQTFAPAVLVDRVPPTPARVVASGPGHLLAGRLLDGPDAAAYRDRLVARLLAPDMLAAPGLRTKSTTAARFAPGSYHNGSVWPVDTGVLADGLRRHGYIGEADDLEERILAACAVAGSPVEFFRGDADGGIRVNTRLVEVMEGGVMRRAEQPPQLVQGWTVTRLWRILRRRGAVTAPLTRFPAPAHEAALSARRARPTPRDPADPEPDKLELHG